MKSSQGRRGIVAIACALVAFVPPARAGGSAQTDPCSVLTADQVKTALGVEVAPGAPISKRACQWKAKTGRGLATVTLQSGDSWAKMKAMPLAPPKPVSGVGDDAFIETFGKFSSLGVKKGNTVFIVKVYGVDDVAKQEAIETALAKNVAAKL